MNIKTKRETILIVGDDPSVRNMVVVVLEDANFTVLSAHDGPSAIRFAGSTNEKINLLLSDVDMPGMSGPSLGEVLKRARPDMHVMLMSGGDNGNLIVLNHGWAYIEKPFVPVKLVQMITDVLGSRTDQN